MNDRFAQRMADRKVAHDTRLLGDFADIFCAGDHPERTRRPLSSDASRLGVYGKRVPVLCDECAEHVRYAEKRRAYCPKDPKPSAGAPSVITSSPFRKVRTRPEAAMWWTPSSLAERRSWHSRSTS